MSDETNDDCFDANYQRHLQEVWDDTLLQLQAKLIEQGAPEEARDWVVEVAKAMFKQGVTAVEFYLKAAPLINTISERMDKSGGI